MNKAKKFNILVLLCVLAFALTLCACGDGQLTEEETQAQPINIMQAYEQFNDRPQYIEVEMSDEYVGSFIIDDTDDIDEIYTLIINADYYLCENLLPPGSNKYLTFVFADNSKVEISSRYIYYSGKMYSASQSQTLNIDNLLISIGSEKGEINTK